MSTPPTTCLSMQRAIEYLGDRDGALGLLGTLEASLQKELPQIELPLERGDLPGANRLLHQIKGFAPVFCVDTLVADVVRVEGLSKGSDLQAVQMAYAQLAPRLQQLLAEVQAMRAQPR